MAVDRLYAKGLVSRVESAEDRRIRIVALTPAGKKVIIPVFQKHVTDMKKVFSALSPDELQQLENILKKVGRHAEALGVGEGRGGNKSSRRFFVLVLERNASGAETTNGT